ncbi:MAG: hypothetical protein SGPRY_009384 [Prymnesium sp.]
MRSGPSCCGCNAAGAAGNCLLERLAERLTTVDPTADIAVALRLLGSSSISCPSSASDCGTASIVPLPRWELQVVQVVAKRESATDQGDQLGVLACLRSYTSPVTRERPPEAPAAHCEKPRQPRRLWSPRRERVSGSKIMILLAIRRDEGAIQIKEIF